MFSADFLEEVRSRSDLIAMVGRDVKLKKAGKDFSGLCPFHSEKSPSFTVSEAKQFYHCFGCGAHGDVISWLVDYSGLGFIESVESLAHSAGLALPERDIPSPEMRERKARSVALTEVLARARDEFFHDLRNAPDAIRYLRDDRGLVKESVKVFALGYAGGSIAQKLNDVSEQVLLAAGLLTRVEETGVVRDKFWQRVMFPIHNEQGDVVGFGGRVLDAREPKYLNTAETEVFHKGNELYGLHLAKTAIRQSRIALVVEGYMDVVMLHQHGDPRAVAALGTSFTEQQARRLFRLADEVVFCFDGDKAGRAASDRAARTVLQVIPEGKRASFITLPGEHDPDSYVKAYGLEAWQAYLRDTGVPLSRKALDMIQAGRDVSLAEDRTAIAKEATELLESIGQARLFRSALLGDIERVISMKLRIKAQKVESPSQATDPEQPRPDAARKPFYRQFALLCALDAQAAAAVPVELVDGFATLLSGWYGCAPQSMQERIGAVSAIRDGDLRRTIVASLEGARERMNVLNAEQLADEVAAVAASINEELALRQREQEAAALFA